MFVYLQENKYYELILILFKIKSRNSKILNNFNIPIPSQPGKLNKLNY